MSKTQASATPARKVSKPANPAAPADGRRIQVRRSGVHGKGVYALQDLAEGETLIEYAGEVITWPEALRRHPHDPSDPNHTFYFHVDEQHVIDGKQGGNSSRWINHSCKPNCEADENEGRVFIKTLRNIKAGEELFYDYGLIIDAPYTKKLLAEYPCWCGAKKCRGTLLAPKEKDAKKAFAKKKVAAKNGKDAAETGNKTGKKGVKAAAEKKSSKKASSAKPAAKVEKKAEKKTGEKAGKKNGKKK